MHAPTALKARRPSSEATKANLDGGKTITTKCRTFTKEKPAPVGRGPGKIGSRSLKQEMYPNFHVRSVPRGYALRKYEVERPTQERKKEKSKDLHTGHELLQRGGGVRKHKGDPLG